MKHIVKTIFFSLLLSLPSMASGQDINGVWQDSTGTGFKNCIAIFSVQNDSVFMSHYLEFNGIPFVESGRGTVLGDTLNYQVRVTRQIPGWSTAGLHQLILSADRKTLRGTYADNLGNTGTLVFKRISK